MKPKLILVAAVLALSACSTPTQKFVERCQHIQPNSCQKATEYYTCMQLFELEEDSKLPLTKFYNVENIMTANCERETHKAKSFKVCPQGAACDMGV